VNNETITDSQRIELDFPAECIRVYLDCVVSHGLIHIPSPSYHEYLVELHDFARFLQHDALIKWTICQIRTNQNLRCPSPTFSGKIRRRHKPIESGILQVAVQSVDRDAWVGQVRSDSFIYECIAGSVSRHHRRMGLPSTCISHCHAAQ
jgi:hypothetical protein